MAAIETFRFSGFTLRPAGASHSDIAIASEWTQADPDHRDHMVSSFWVEQRMGVDSYLLLDKDGPLFFFRADRDRTNVFVHIQFPPREKAETRERVRQGLLQGLPWLERVLRQVGVQQIAFDSESRALIAFVTRELGFRQKGNRLEKTLG